MNYEVWREDLFGQHAETDPVDAELMRETYELSPSTTLDYIDRALTDSEIHELYSRPQIGIGLQQFFCNRCSNFPLHYVEGTDEQRRTRAIDNLRNLYANYFERYCLAPVTDIGNNPSDGELGYLCYMFWDVFVVYPGNSTKAMMTAAVAVMSAAIRSENDQCIVSAIHGLGHWVHDAAAAQSVLKNWLVSPTTFNRVVIDYAKHASTGCIL